MSYNDKYNSHDLSEFAPLARSKSVDIYCSVDAPIMHGKFELSPIESNYYYEGSTASMSISFIIESMIEAASSEGLMTCNYDCNAAADASIKASHLESPEYGAYIASIKASHLESPEYGAYIAKMLISEILQLRLYVCCERIGIECSEPTHYTINPWLPENIENESNNIFSVVYQSNQSMSDSPFEFIIAKLF